MSASDDNSSRRSNPEDNNNDRAESSSCRIKEGSGLSSSSANLKHKVSPEASYMDNNDVYTSTTKNVAAEFTNDNENAYLNRVPEDISDEQSILLPSPSIEVQDWKCRECGFVNKDKDTVCDTCETPKPMRPCLETRRSYYERSPPASPSNRRSPSAEKGTMYNRTGSLSPSSFRRQDSSREQSPSEMDRSDDEKPSTRSPIRSRDRRKTSQSSSADDNQNPASIDITKQRRLSQNSTGARSSSRASPYSEKRDEEHIGSEYKSESKKTISDAPSSSHQSYEYDKNGSRPHSEMRFPSPLPDYVSSRASHKDDTRNGSIRSDLKLGFSKDVEEDRYQTFQPQQNVFSATTSKRSQSRSPSPRRDDEKQSYSSPYEDKDHQSRRTAATRNKSPENKYDRKHPEDDYKSESKKITSDASSTVHRSNESRTSSNRLYPELHSSPSSSVLQKDEAVYRQDDSREKKSYASSDKDNDHRSTAKQRKSSHSPSSSNMSKRTAPIVAYVPDLPVNIASSQSLENMIRECLELKHKQKVLDVKCNTQLGIGMIYLPNDDDKHTLVKIIGRIIIELTNNTTVSFVDELELISYVVIHTKDGKCLPSADDICRRWVHLYKGHSQPKCEQLSVQFPNIFRITTHSLDELIDAISTKDFLINDQCATVYFRADCCFFEDLPRTTNLDRLKEAIRKLITEQYMSKEFMHIQYNKDGANAVVLTSGSPRIWALHNSIQLDGRVIMKKDSLACRLLIRNVPKGISTSLVRDHKVFAGTVIKTLPSNDHIILELSDRNVYERCIDLGALRIGDDALGIEVYTLSSNPEDSEIDAETWYETEMCDYKPNIMPFISNPQHHIFRYKWNSQAFLKQFQHWSSNERGGNSNGKNQVEHEKLCNLKRHLLRMTVMLNTVGVVKKGYYRIGDKEMKIKPDRLKTIVYNHKSKLQHSKTIPLSEATTFPYARTSVKVVNEDCLIVYKKLVSQGCRPVILNMANATSPGGGYTRGDGAQEETLFRRSNYFQSLDRELDDGKPSMRSYCTSNCDLVPVDERHPLYPMDDYGAIYTSGLTVFRQPEDTGYTFMDIPMYDVCAIAMAAYRDPKLDNNNLLASKYSIGTRKKIENIFAIAYQHKHDCLVLSALGCGAFRNPPKHVATIFKSVIEQYAGYFKCIYFAIIDDHNTGQDFNPNGNYRPFQKILDNFDAEPKKYKMIDMMIGPWRILNQTTTKEVTLSDIKICYLNPCHNGGKCNDLKNNQHCREYSHPPLCPYTDNKTSCKEKNDDQHTLWFRHRLQCSYGGECELLEKDVMHSNEFEHPEFCHDGGGCENLDRKHLKSYRHVPLCKHRRQCIDYNRKSNDHCKNFRHCIPMCRFGKYCVRFHDDKHFTEENHPFLPACPFTPFHCQAYNTLSQAKNIKTLSPDIQNHCLRYSHVCRYGRLCHERSDVHLTSTIHVARHMCSYRDQCTKIDQEDHLNSFSHPNIADIRRLCPQQGFDCRDKRKPEHMTQYRHHGNHDRSGVIGYFGQNKRTHFVDNQETIVKAINDYAAKSKQTLTVPIVIQKFVKGLQPVHRCSKVIFESILVHGHVMSSEHMEHLKKPHFAAQAVQEHKHIQAIFSRYKMPIIEDYARDYIRAIVSREYAKKYSAGPVAEAAFSLSRIPLTSTAPDDYDSTIRIKERFLKSMLKPEEIDVIRKRAIDIAEASWNLHNTPTGIKYAPDKILGTDKHVFSILGPHLGYYYGDIVLVFKSEVMLHPDANFSPQAATSFASGRTFTNRPWVEDPGNDRGRVKCFHESKLHCSIPGYEYAAAAELIAITGLHKKTMNVDVEAILNRWKKVDSHEVFEAHLPQLVPLDYIDEVYIPKNLFESLTPAAQESARKSFRSSLHITDHDITLTASGGGGAHHLDKSRSKYQEFVIDKLIEKIQKRIERPPAYHGTVITLAPSQFTDHVVLPLTINKAYDQYRRTHKHGSNSDDDVYIYWQTMYGDMMVTLSNEPLNSDAAQPNIRCLVCYIAERPSTTTTNYNESYSYLNAGEPYRHSVIMVNGQCSDSSRSFYRGCNIEDFLTYCLKIEKKTGQVTLSHAGPNGIYCYETITCNFSKTALDLSKLRYIHVSAGSQKIPVRNLIISFEPIADLHPSFDKNFKQTDDTLPRRKKSPGHDRSSSPKLKESPREKSPSLLNKAKNVIGGLLGYGGDDKKVESNDESHRVEQCPFNTACQKLDDPIHRAKYRHTGYPDVLIPCRDKSSCRNKTVDHRIKYSHDEQVDVKKDKIDEKQGKSSSQSHSEYQETVSSDIGKDDQKPPCRHGNGCRDKNDSEHCSKFSHPDGHGSRPSASSSLGQKACRHGNDCRDQNDSQHCSKFSHPDGHGYRPSASPSLGQKACRHGNDCRDKNDSEHCSKFSHPNGHGSRPSASSSLGQKACRHGNDCRDKNDSQHCSQFSHPDGHGSRPSASPSLGQKACRHGNDCRDKNDSQHCSKFSHPNK